MHPITLPSDPAFELPFPLQWGHASLTLLTSIPSRSEDTLGGGVGDNPLTWSTGCWRSSQQQLAGLGVWVGRPVWARGPIVYLPTHTLNEAQLTVLLRASSPPFWNEGISLVWEKFSTECLAQQSFWAPIAVVEIRMIRAPRLTDHPEGPRKIKLEMVNTSSGSPWASAGRI